MSTTLSVAQPNIVLAEAEAGWLVARGTVDLFAVHRDTGVRRSLQAGALHVRLREPSRPELLLVVDEHRVEDAKAHERREIGGLAASEIVVLQVGVLDAHGPTGVVRGVGGVLLLEDVRRDANARAIPSRHAEGEVDALEIELVEVLCLDIGAILIIAVDDAGEIDGWNRDLSLRREQRRRSEQDPGGECS